MIFILKLIFTVISLLFKSREFFVLELMAKNQQLALYANTIKSILENSEEVQA